MKTHENKRNNDTGKPPNLLVIGAQKAGTSSLHYYLNLHPEIFMSSTKELNFFNDKKIQKQPHKDFAWYQSQFESDCKILGDTSPSYTNVPVVMNIPEKIANHLTNVKMIYIVRDPIERILSHYNLRASKRAEVRSVEEAVLDGFPDNRYIWQSKYFSQLSHYKSHFAPEQILIVRSEDLGNQTLQTMSQIFRFLEVDEHYQDERYSTRLNASSSKRVMNPLGRWLRKLPGVKSNKHTLTISKWIGQSFVKSLPEPVLSPATREKLVAELKADVDSLRNHTGQSFSDWSL